MSHIWALAAKDLLQTRRDRLAALFTLILPVIFTMFFGFLFAGTSSDRLPVALVNADTGAAAAQVVDLLKQSGILDLQVKDAAAAEKAVKDEKVAAAILIPSDFSATLDATGKAALTLVGTEGSSGAQTVMQSVQSAANRVATEKQATSIAVQVAAAALPGGQDGSLPPKAAAAVKAQLDNPAAVVATVDAGLTAGQVPRGFDLSSPGMLINWILFSLLTAGTVLVNERRSRTLQRLLTTRMTRAQVILGTSLAMVILTLFQQVVLIGLGQFVFGVHYLNSPSSLVLCMITLSVLSASLGLLIATIFRTEPAVIATTVIVSMVLAAMSGAWFPLEITGPAFSAVGHAMPTAWVLDSLRGIILRGFTLSDVVPRLAVAWVYALAFFALAVWRFRFE
jgi:ABC-2 type transport system permease protein